LVSPACSRLTGGLAGVEEGWENRGFPRGSISPPPQRPAKIAGGYLRRLSCGSVAEIRKPERDGARHGRALFQQKKMPDRISPPPPNNHNYVC